MKKNILLLIAALFLFSGCFSLSSLNPFSDTKESENKKVIEIPDNAPSWLQEDEETGNITALGATKYLQINEEKLNKQKALISAGNNLSRKIYIKTVLIYKEYLEEAPSNNIFEKDIKDSAKNVALNCLKISRIKGFWQSDEKELYTKISVETQTVVKEIQQISKKLFNQDSTLEKYMLSEEAKQRITELLEE